MHVGYIGQAREDTPADLRFRRVQRQSFVDEVRLPALKKIQSRLNPVAFLRRYYLRRREEAQCASYVTGRYETSGRRRSASYVCIRRKSVALARLQ